MVVLSEDDGSDSFDPAEAVRKMITYEVATRFQDAIYLAKAYLLGAPCILPDMLKHADRNHGVKYVVRVGKDIGICRVRLVELVIFTQILAQTEIPKLETISFVPKPQESVRKMTVATTPVQH